MFAQFARQFPRATFVTTLHCSKRVISVARCPRKSVAAYLASPRRMYATPPPQVNESSLNIEKYHAKSDHVMDSLTEQLEELFDDAGEPTYEVDLHSGVLTVTLGSHGTYVINKQPPNKQIWLSSPISGPKRYDYVEESDEWVYGRDGVTLNTLLSEELSSIFGQPVQIQF